MLAHIPGVKLVVPHHRRERTDCCCRQYATRTRSSSSNRRRLYPGGPEDVTDDGVGIPLQTCLVLRSGGDITLVSWRAMLKETVAAAERLLREGEIEADVIDVASLKPLDSTTILNSVAGTGRLVIVHEAPLTCGTAPESQPGCTNAGSMKPWPHRSSGSRVTNTMMPYPRTEAWYMPSVDRVIAAARRVVAYQ